MLFQLEPVWRLVLRINARVAVVLIEAGVTVASKNEARVAIEFTIEARVVVVPPK